MNLYEGGSSYPTSSPQTLRAFIQLRVQQNPDVKYIEVNQAGDQVATTFADLHSRALQILASLLDCARAGESDIVLCFDSALDFIAAAWACIYGGYSSHPWHIAKFSGHNQQITRRLDAIERRLRDPVLLTRHGIKEANFQSDRTLFRTVLSIDRDLRKGGTAGLGITPSLPDATLAEDAAFFVATSGTTELAKFAVIKQQRLLNRFLALKEQPRRILCFPFDGITGMRLLFPWVGDCIYLQPNRMAAQPLELLKLVEKFRIPGISVSPSALARILNAIEGSSPRHDLSSLKRLSLGSEMISPDIVRSAGKFFREMGAQDLKVSFGYGMTETGLICRTGELGIDQAVQSNPVVVGRCLTGWTVRIVDDAGALLPPGAAGNIEVQSDTLLFDGYRNEPEQNGHSFTSDGWFKTGDVGAFADGCLTILGRQKATIIVHAKNISLESIEAPLRYVDGIHAGLLAAAALRNNTSSLDELAIFFVSAGDDPSEIDKLCRSMSQEIWRLFQVPVKHFIPVKRAADFPLTSTGKIRRYELVHRFQSGLLAPHPIVSHGTSTGRPLTEIECWLSDLWKKLLKLDHLPALEDRFFDLGGDSLASAELIFSVEDKFSCQLPVQEFFQQPTIANLVKLVEQRKLDPVTKSSGQPALGGYRLLHELQSYTGSWPGSRLFADSLIVGCNQDGHRTPIFWIFQDRKEFLQLAKHVGAAQPIYGMRSCVGIIPVREYTQDVIETVCNRYLWEILALPVQAPFFIGGNCQAGILALALARKLKHIARTPSLLMLMEWIYSYGAYTEPTLLLYGDRSYTADIYQNAGTRVPNWREDFPVRTVESISGSHGRFFLDENITSLAEVIMRHVSAFEKSSATLRS